MKQFDNDYQKMIVNRNNTTYLLFGTIFLAVATIIGALIFAFMVSSSAYSKVAVVDSQGQYLQTSIMERSGLEEALIKQSCANLNHYLNNLDNNNLVRNYNSAIDYCNSADIQAVAEFYKAENIFYNITERGIVLKAVIQSFDKIEEVENKIEVQYTIEQTIFDGKKRSVTIKSKGVLIPITPMYPQNTTGYFFEKYNQYII